MPGVIPDARGSVEGWLCRVWYYSGVVGACGWRVSDGDRDAEQLVPADRFAHEIGPFLTLVLARLRRLNSTVRPHSSTWLALQQLLRSFAYHLISHFLGSKHNMHHKRSPSRGEINYDH
jgi:hypothetical protein